MSCRALLRWAVAAVVASVVVAPVLGAPTVGALAARHGDHDAPHVEGPAPMMPHASHNATFNYDSVSPKDVPAFCVVDKGADRAGHDELRDCLARDEVDLLLGADAAGWALRPSPTISMSNVHAHAHGSEPPMVTLNETRLFLRKGAVPLSYVEWDFGAGLGRISELRRFVGEDAKKVQETWPERPVIGRSGGYWRTVADADYPAAWNALREDLQWRLGDGTEEPSRQRGLAVLTTVLFVLSTFILLPLVLCLQSAQSSLVPLLSLLYLATFTSSVLFGRLYFALSPALYPPSALPGLVRALLFLSYACFSLPAAQLLFLVVPLVRGRLRSWADVQRLLQVVTAGPTPHLRDSTGLAARSSSGSGEESLAGEGMERLHDSYVMFDQERDNGAPLLASPTEVPDVRFGASDAAPSARRRWDAFVHRYPRLHFALGLLYTTVSRALVPLAFVVVYVAIAIYTGSCRRGYKNVCLAHGIKGAIFFWYGVLSFARYLGAFGEYGWAWNKRPTLANTRHSRAAYWRCNMPSGEFIECTAIFLYGISNTWLERLGASAGDPYTIKQIQHISIAVMFWFVGLVGMMLESTRVRALLAYAVTLGHPAARAPQRGQGCVEAQSAPPSYVSSFNPFPALVIGVTGVAMAAHHQDYVYEVEVHILWGEMLAAFALLRCLTYFLLWLRPPTSVLPSRPPTEAIGSFALCCGGLLFMLSNEEVSFAAMRADYADGMAVMNVAVSAVGLVFSWTFAVMLVKAWAVRRQAEAAHGNTPISLADTPTDAADVPKEAAFVVDDTYESA